MRWFITYSLGAVALTTIQVMDKNGVGVCLQILASFVFAAVSDWAYTKTGKEQSNEPS